MQVLHNLINGPQRLTNSKPNPKMQYSNMIYQIKKHVSQYLFDCRPTHMYCIFFTKNESFFCRLICLYCKILANAVTLFFWDTSVGTLLCGKNPITIFNAYM